MNSLMQDLSNNKAPAEKIEGTRSGRALVVLHEIYGLNRFIQDQKRLYVREGFDVYSPNMIQREPFEYGESEAAYAFFMKNVGFGVRDEVSLLVQKLKAKYERIYMLGYSVGATVAWLCSDLAALNGIVACYGSRIREHTHRDPLVPTLLILARHDSYDIGDFKKDLSCKNNLTVKEFEARHGFLDPYSEHYDQKIAAGAGAAILKFLEEH